MNTKLLKIYSSLIINILFISIVFHNQAFSQSNAYALSLSNSSSAQGNFWSLHDNIAGISELEKTTVGTSVENRFLIKEMKYYNLGIVIPLNWGSNGLMYSHKGFANFRNHKMAYAFARGFGEKLSVGLKLIYQRLSYSKEMDASNYIGFDLGFRSIINKKLILAVLFKNPANIFYSYTAAPPEPSIINIGALISTSDDLNLYVSIIKILNLHTTINAGIEYSIHQKVNIRLSCTPSPFVLAFGIGLKYNRFTIDLASSYHHILGFTPCISIRNTFGK